MKKKRKGRKKKYPESLHCSFQNKKDYAVQIICKSLLHSKWVSMETPIFLPVEQCYT
jgi:hypothetical protein